jgi:hypothetical protein
VVFVDPFCCCIVTSLPCIDKHTQRDARQSVQQCFAQYEKEQTDLTPHNISERKFSQAGAEEKKYKGYCFFFSPGPKKGLLAIAVQQNSSTNAFSALDGELISGEGHITD